MPPERYVLAYAVASAILIVIPGPSVLFTAPRAGSSWSEGRAVWP